MPSLPLCPPSLHAHPPCTHPRTFQVKLNWMNGQHLKQLPKEELTSLVSTELVRSGMLRSASTPFAQASVGLVNKGLVSEGQGVGWLGAGG